MAGELTLEAAERVVAAGKKRGEELGQPMCIAVADGGANLVAFARMDQRLLAALDIARRKAVTAVGFQLQTRELAALAQPGAPLFGIASVGATVLGGGVPLTGGDGRVVGGVGGSGGSPERDHDVAAAGAAVL